MIQDISFADPAVWIIGGIVLVAVAFILIYFKLLAGETRYRQ